ncbi:hypothetical protein QF023_002041 [Chryseobacterium sp. SLBN-27]|uniref:right-handed parallel beta-helix repeat-containing protein n=1 Tax=Chryseobacterium TaxID=59732 RepID=UPI00285EDCAE|nr:right-handed parallel beta-helix repeat-containing protein [Chryseobacterium sp. SLBN-27]MDR6158525.1 hypothetical protein [Chryseobacterium sp. SLBN-27]
MNYIMDFPNISGDGIHDDTAGIQAALNIVKDIYFGSNDKTFLISDSLKLQDNHKLFSSGATIIQGELQKSIFDFSASASNLAKKNISIVGFNLIGCQNEKYDKNLKSNSEAKAIKCDYAKNITIKDNNFKNFMYSPLMGNYVDNFLFVHNTCFGFDSWNNWLPPNTTINSEEPRDNTGITIGGNNVKIIENTISNTSQGIFIILGSKNVLIKSNYIFNTIYEHGIYVDSGVSNLTISDNIINTIIQTGLKIQNYDSSSSGINYEYADSKNIVVSNNTVSNTGADGILVLNAVPENPPRIFAINVLINGNILSNIFSSAINIRCAKYCTIANNVMNGNGIGLYIDNAHSSTINNNIVNNSNENGIYDQGTGQEIVYINNYINDSGKISSITDDRRSNIFLVNGSNRYLINNVIKESPTHNLAIEDGNLTSWEIKNNSFLDSEYTSIRIITKTNSENFRYFGENVLKSKSGTSEITLTNDSQIFQTAQLGNQDIYFTRNQSINSINVNNYKRGSIIINSSPSNGGFVGWVNTGSAWKLFGEIEN